jgi:hypothetical protein
LLAESTSNAALFPPQRIGDIPYLTESDQVPIDDKGKTAAMGKTFKMSFPAPPTAGSTTLQVYLISDTFIGSTVVKTVTVRQIAFVIKVLAGLILFVCDMPIS